MPENLNNFFSLDLKIQIPIIVGIVCYFILRSGVTKEDKPLLILLITMVFASTSSIIWKLSIALAILIWTNEYFNLLAPPILCIVLPIFLCFLARKYDWVNKAFKWLNKHKLTNQTQYGNSWISMIANTNCITSQMVVFMKSGEVLVSRPKDLKHYPLEKPMKADFDGNIALLVTHRFISKQDYYKNNIKKLIYKHETNKGYAYPVTYISNSEIDSVEMLLRDSSKENKVEKEKD